MRNCICGRAIPGSSEHAATCEHGLRINGASMAHQKDNPDAMCPFNTFIYARALAAQALDAQLDARLMRSGRLMRNLMRG